MRKVHFFCSFVQQRQTSSTSNTNNSNLKSASKTKRRNKTDVQNLEITLRIPPIAPLFSALCDFFETLDCTKAPPSFFSKFCNIMDIKKPQRVPPFYIFRHCDTVQKSHFKNFFGEFFQVPKGLPFNFFSYFATSWNFTKPEGSPLLQF